MMVRREFRAQAADLEATDLLAAFQVVQSFAIAGQDLLCFFKCVCSASGWVPS